VIGSKIEEGKKKDKGTKQRKEMRFNSQGFCKPIN
jgi:hypothetical protein